MPMIPEAVFAMLACAHIGPVIRTGCTCSLYPVTTADGAKQKNGTSLPRAWPTCHVRRRPSRIQYSVEYYNRGRYVAAGVRH